MYTVSAKLTFFLPHVSSLKDKRQICRSIVDKSRQKFNASIAEVDTQDIHQTLTIGVAVVSGEMAHAQKSVDGIVRFMEEHGDGELVGVEISDVPFDDLEYDDLMEEMDDLRLIEEAEKRLAEGGNFHSSEDIMGRLGITETFT